MGIAVLVSGTGTILQSLIDHEIPIAVVFADRPCGGLEVATKAKIQAELVDRRQFGGFGPDFDRVGYTSALVEAITPYEVELVAMAGFGTVLAEPIHIAFPHRILNTHPALLPAYKGWHAVEDALADGAKVTGCTVHLAELDVDTGPILAQAEVRIEPGDDADTLHERIKAVERRIYPEAVKRVLRAIERGEDPARMPILIRPAPGPGTLR